jgi:gag-polyprotein putative aspartyl protease
VNDLRSPTVYMKDGLRRDTAWIGTLRTNRNLVMEGRLFDRDGKLLYGEELIDFKMNPKGPLRMSSLAFCGPDPSGARWRTIAGSNSPSSVASSPVPRWTLPPQASLAPPPPPQPIAAPPSNGGDIVPIVVDHGRARVAVNFADYPLPQTMVIDTGASIMSVTNELAAALIERDMAYRMDQQTNICLADGACRERDQIMIRKLSIGGRTVMDVPAIMVQDNVEMLLPFGVLNQVGKFTIDSAKGLLIFG